MNLIKRITLKIWQAKVKNKQTNKKDSRLNFSKYRNAKKFNSLSFTSKFDYLKEICDTLEQFKNIKSTREKSEQKTFADDNASDPYNK